MGRQRDDSGAMAVAGRWRLDDGGREKRTEGLCLQWRGGTDNIGFPRTRILLECIHQIIMN